MLKLFCKLMLINRITELIIELDDRCMWNRTLREHGQRIRLPVPVR